MLGERLLKLKREIEELNEKMIRAEERIKTYTEELREKEKASSVENAKKLIISLETEIQKKAVRVEKEIIKVKNKYSL